MRGKQILCGMITGALLLSAVTVFADSRMPGDLNGDGMVNSADQRLLLRAMATLTYSRPADLNEDGVLDMADAEMLWQLSLQTKDEQTTVTEQTTTADRPSATDTDTTDRPSATTRPTASETTKPTAAATTTTKKPTTAATTTKKPTTTTKKPTTTTTKKPTTTTTTVTTTTTQKPSGGTVSAQVRPSLPAVTTPAYTPTVRTFTGRDSSYTLSVKNTKTGTVYDNSTPENLQRMLTYIVKIEMGQATFATNSTEAWKAQAVAAYTHLLYSYSDRTYPIYGHSDVDLSHPNDKKIYDAVGEVLGVKILNNGSSPICSYYSGSAAGTTRDNQTGWGLSYIQPVFSPETVSLCQKYGYTKFVTSGQFTLAQILSTMTSTLGATVKAEEKDGAYPLYARTWIGAYIGETNLYYTKNGVKTYVTGRQLREALQLNSASIVVTEMTGDKMTLTVHGHGHGMGFSQVGAAIFANEYGWNYRQILAHYYGMTASSSHQLYDKNW